MIEKIRTAGGIMAFILVISLGVSLGVVLPIYMVSKEAQREGAATYMIQDHRGKQYFSNSVNESNNVIEFTDIDNRHIKLKGIYTLIKRK